ncbi:PD-(D/E)XK nuclease family protein [bacterium]|nr:PD-(D/E)XK nuclease family protein [bacterium]
MTEMDTRLTHSQRRCLDTCKRKHYLAYVLRIRPRTDGRALRIGSAVHHGIHLWTMGKPRRRQSPGPSNGLTPRPRRRTRRLPTSSSSTTGRRSPCWSHST